MKKSKRYNKTNDYPYSLIPSSTSNTNLPSHSTSEQGPILVDQPYLCSSPSHLTRPLLGSQHIDMASSYNNNNNRNLTYGATTEYNSDTETTGSRPDDDDGQDDVYLATMDRKDQIDIDYILLDTHIEQEALTIKTPKTTFRRRRLSTVTDPRRYSFYGDCQKYSGMDNSEANRISYYSTAEPSTIHARYLCEIPPEGVLFSDMLKKGCFWIDLLNPSDTEMRTVCQAFRIHPLTEEDIIMEEQQEKCEVFPNYYFICFRSFEQDPSSPMYLQPLAIYIVVLKEGVLTFHFRPTPHPHNVRKRIKQLRDYINVSPDWICYGLLDEITDSFAPLNKSIEFQVDSIDELVLILKETEQSDMLRRIGYCRKRVMGLLRLLVPKADVVKTLIKRGETKPEDATRPELSTEVSLFLGDVQDHLLTMLQSLNHYEKISSRSHSNYLAHISIEMTQTNNEINDILSKLTALGSVLIPMNLVTGLWGMNVQVPGQLTEDLTWFTCITASILTFCISMTLLMRYYNIV